MYSYSIKTIDIPSVQPCKLVLLLFIPDGSLLEVVLVTKSARDGAPSRQAFGNVIPLHPLTTEFDGEVVLLGGPF
jgi:hypothetical protein